LDGYIAQAAEQAGERALAEHAASAVLQVVTDFAPAKKLHSPAFKAAPAAATAPANLADCLQQAEAHFNQDDLAGAAAALRQAVVLDGLTTKEAARLLRLPQGTVKTRLARAKVRLRTALAEGSS
jgi:DNA-directed RNA polymerase specialized sigma24 family protein